MIVNNETISLGSNECRPISEYVMESNKSTKRQLYYIGILVEKVYKLLNGGLKASEALNRIRSSVFKGICIHLDLINYSPIEESLMSKMITYLGGSLEISKNYSSVTHIITNRTIDKRYVIKNKTYVNLKWLFHCYFYYERMDVNDEEYLALK